MARRSNVKEVKSKNGRKNREFRRNKERERERENVEEATRGKYIEARVPPSPFAP